MDAVVTAWLEQEEAFLARQRSHGQPEDGGLARPEEVLPLTGLEMLEGMIAGRFPAPPIAYTLRFFLLEVGDGRAVFQGQPKQAFFNPLGTVHGGWYATLLDSALGCAVHTTILPGERYTTMEFKVNLVRALAPDLPRVRAVGRLRHRGRQMATAEADLVGPDDRLYAHASTTCLILPPRD